MFKLKNIAKKFNLHILDETIENRDIELSEITGINSIEKREGMNFGIVINKESDPSQNIDKISLIIICGESSLDDKTRKRFISYKKPVVYTKFSKREVALMLDSFLWRKQQTPERMHATLLSIFGEGILIIGASGIGKSELALELINRKHLFIGDDAIDLISFAGTPIGRAPKISRDFIEVRGVGIINVKGMYGIQVVMKETQIKLIIELVHLDDVKSSIDRLGKEYSYRTVAGVKVPVIQVPVSSGRGVATVVESAVISFKQRTDDNYVAIDDLNERIRRQ